MAFFCLIVNHDIEERFKQRPLIINDRVVFTSLDSTYFETRRPTKSQKTENNVTHKVHSKKITFMCDFSGNIVYGGEPFDGSVKDIPDVENIVEFMRLNSNGEKILTDKGYIQEEYDDVFLTPYKGNPSSLTLSQREFNKVHHSQRSILENLFGRFTSFAIINGQY
ncbi:hypothetical protein DICPUDRAFT_76326 [Dictyostelium purpureum]|uniref:DDE Tnp4 domain-containing protein n=1 Tax=Dictyostelium purpureum TaxID=5786 RepID=F0ZD98_DICPU|nr:uncharacterized protein DICPUDRAFT_76326 [Dictyostelium purpureum]EGC38070.1 hypothetical protein DICPUDRAFT_76326 [Dictyostelium purpureum]|eukprot:XP_003285377.1 hypothetical protein DICPUDRAFT_76326 [Dictyostelium purpureum]